MASPALELIPKCAGAITIELAQQGAKRLLLVARDRQRLAEVATPIEALGVEVVILALKICDRRCILKMQ